MRSRFHPPAHATVVAYLALFIAMGGTAAAATGNLFVLGHDNRADRSSALINRAGTPLQLRAQAGRPPLKVNTEARVRHFNADLLDGRSSSAFLPAAGKASDADRLDGRESADFLPAFCPEGPTAYVDALTGCTKLTRRSAHMAPAIPGFVPDRPGQLVMCPAGQQAIAGGYGLADDPAVVVRASEPFGPRYTSAGWYVELRPGASPASISSSVVWVVCFGA